MRIVHILARLGMTGPVRSLAAFAEYGKRAGLPWIHEILVLESQIAPAAVALLRLAGARLHLRLERSAQAAVLAGADLTLVHYWQCPSMVAFLATLPPTRRVVTWTHTLGLHPPQSIAATLGATSDAIWCTTEATLDAPVCRDRPVPPPVVRGLIDPDRLLAPECLHEGIVIGYIGTLNAQKLHPRFVALCSEVHQSEARFVVYGAGGQQRQLLIEAERMGLSNRFEVRGHVDDVGQALAGMDVLGYPLNRSTYASSDLAVQEAMWAGVPPVVLPHGGVPHLIQDVESGIIAEDEADYVAAIERLVCDAGERQRLADNARIHARASFDPADTVQRVDRLLAEAMEAPARAPRVGDWGGTPAAWFVTALAESGAPFHRSLAAGPGGDPDAEAAIAACPELVAVGEGGIFQWRNAFPNEPALREWAALLLEVRGDSERAAGERAAGAKLRRGGAS